jgi:hypothetical protein
MAKTAGRKTAAKKQNKSIPPEKVWCVSRFGERYEYRDDKGKKGTLQYTRAYVTAGADAESRHFMDQLEELKEKKNWRTLEGTLNELIRRAANDIYQYRSRGCLLHQHRPAGIDRIARWLKIDQKTCRQELAALQSVGLIELITLPEVTFENVLPPAEVPENPQKSAKIPETPAQTESESGKKTKRKKTGKPVTREKSKISQAGQVPAGSTKTNQAQTRNPKEKQPDGQRKGITGTMQDETKPESLPVNPPIPEAMGDKGQTTGKSPPGSVNSSIAGAMDRLYEPSCSQFAGEIFHTIFRRQPIESSVNTRQATEDLSELASFASAWAMAQNAKLNPATLTMLWNRAVFEANKLCVNRRRKPGTRNPRAVWWTIFKGLLRVARAGNLQSKKGFS